MKNPDYHITPLGMENLTARQRTIIRSMSDRNLPDHLKKETLLKKGYIENPPQQADLLKTPEPAAPETPEPAAPKTPESS